MNDENPILNSPYEEPSLHYATDSDGALNYTEIRKERRIFTPDPYAIPERQKNQLSVFDINDHSEDYRTQPVNLIRQEVKQWRNAGYPETTRVTRELLYFWFKNPERIAIKKLFFAQQEAVETAIWLNEVAPKSNPGQHVLNTLHNKQQEVSFRQNEQLPRVAFKMATGTGKTVVMGCLILYHYFNRQEYRQDTRFNDYFLIIAPGITIKDRLGVLFVDKSASNKNLRQDYYAIRDLVPQSYEHLLGNLNARLIITNYHAFMPHNIQGNKRTPFDGKIGSDGKKTEAKEDYNLVLKRVIGKFKIGSRLLVLNDEAHHCYLPKSKGKTTDNEESDENEKAAIWFQGISEIALRYKLQHVYDLSATPYYLQGSGYVPYSLFPWVVSDFGLIESIESGLVKIPFLPESDNTQELKTPILKDLYNHVKDKLPKKGQKKKKSDAKKEGKIFLEERPQLPNLVKMAFDQFYNHYKEYDEGIRKLKEDKLNLFSPPPVFIVVCNNTSVSKEVYKFIAGYEQVDDEGNIQNVFDGHYEMFSNYDPITKKPKHRSPTLLIDSDALENSGQINDVFKKIFSSEIEEFKKDYARLYGQGSTEKISDSEILREVVNTVGRPGKLGAHIRCVVSVSMLTEGWDANTVTHIAGLRAFGSQLLCEQVAGRALRRMSYYLQAYRKDTGEPIEEKDRHRYKPENIIEKFPPEYAHIIGIPFKLFKGGETTPVPPKDYTHIFAIPERQSDHEIIFPNLDGYRIEYLEEEIIYSFQGINNFELNCSSFPLKTIMASPISADEEKMEVQSVFEKREQEIIYLLTKELINVHFSDDDHNPHFQLFGKLKTIVEEWYNTKVKLIGERDLKFKKLLYFEEPKNVVDHIKLGINPHINTSEFIKPKMNYYNPISSTKYVHGHTTKETYDTIKSHVNKVVMDSDWEAIAAKTMEELSNVKSYVKNQFLGFQIPYVKEGADRLYFPDFIAHVQNKKGEIVNLIIEITGMNKDKVEKKWYVENRWLPAVNAVQEHYKLGPWHFIEIANDIRDIKNQFTDKISSL